MSKLGLLLSFLVISAICNGQTYKKVDTLIQYKDAQIIICGNKRDTVYYHKMKKDINITLVVVMIVDKKRKLKP